MPLLMTSTRPKGHRGDLSLRTSSLTSIQLVVQMAILGVYNPEHAWESDWPQDYRKERSEGTVLLPRYLVQWARD